MKKKRSSNNLTSKKVVIDASQTKISNFFGSANTAKANEAQNIASTTLFSSSQVQLSQENSPSKPTCTKTESPILQPKSRNFPNHSNSSPFATFNLSSVIPPSPEFLKKTTSVTYIPPCPDVPVQLDESTNSTIWIPPTPHPQKSPDSILTKIRTSSSKSSPPLSAKVKTACLPRCKRSLIASDSTGLSPNKKKVAVSKIEETRILEDSFDNILADIDLSNCFSDRVCFTDFLDTPKPPKSPEKTSVSDYLELGRHVVDRVDNFSQDEIVLHLANKKICRLRNMWLHSTVKAGDVINIQGNWVQNECIVDHEQGLVVIHPDVLISGTSVVSSIFCMRKAVLAERVKRPFMNKAMLVGTLAHEMLQKSMQKPEESGRIKAMIDELLGQSANLQELYALNLSETEMRRDLESYVPQIRYIVDKYLFGKNVSMPEPVPCTQSMARKPSKPAVWPGKICHVRDIEENIWSPRLGIKGKIDLTVEVAVHNRARKIVPFELKTGRSSFSAEHRGQLTLYSMMLSERHPDPEGGLLLYLKDCAMNDVPAGTKEKSQLIQLRNEMVVNILAPPFEKEGVLTEAPLPLPIDRASACEKCDHITVCSLYQQANSAIPEAPHDMATLVPRALAHLTSAHIDFYRHWSLLMRLENMEALKKNKTKDLWSKTPQEREKMGSCLSDCVISHTVPVGDQWEVSFVRPNALFNLLGIHCHEKVLISCQKWIAIATGYVTYMDATTITVFADKNLNLYKGETFFIDRMEYQGGMAGLMGYLSALMEDNPRAAKLRELIIDKVQPVFKQGLNKRLTIEGKPILSALNLSQQRSLLVTLTAQDYCLIHGMPGTGKTQVIVALIRLAVMLGQSVLVTSTTHSAVDNVFLRLLPYDLPVLRLGQDYRVHPALRPFTEKAVLRSCTNLDQLERVYNSKMVVGTTCLGSGHTLLRRRNFSICIVDEAGQTLLPSTLGPLFRAEKFVLVGDPLQLSPIVQSGKAKILGLERSLFDCLAQGSVEKAILPLQMQYRMCGPVMDVANALVYEGKLQVGNETVNGARLNIPKTQVYAQYPEWVRSVLQPEQPVMWVDTSQIGAHETRLLKQGGTVNEFEQKLVYYLVQALVKVGVAVGTVGIIAPYQSQVQGIRRNLEKIWPNLEINTIDQYQGKDKDVLLYSCTRSAISNDATSTNNTRGDILNDLRRLTVAVTRAKLKLILMGNSSTLKSYAPFRKLLSILENSQMYKLCVNIDEFSVQQVFARRVGTQAATVNALKPFKFETFENCQLAYGNKDMKALLRAYVTLKLCSADAVVQNSLQLLEAGKYVLGKSLLEKLLRPTLYAQFVGGDNLNELRESVASLTLDGLRLMVLPSLEEDVGRSAENVYDKTKYDANTETTLTLAKATAELGGPRSCLQTKITAIIPADILVRIAAAYDSTEDNLHAVASLAETLTGGRAVNLPKLSITDMSVLNEGLERYKAIGKAAVEKNLRLLVDGEYTYLNPAISLMAMALAAAFNHQRPVVWNTYQCYLRNACDKILSELEVAKKLGVKFGAKIVRGAYLERERQLAKAGGYTDPTNPTYEATSVMYDRVVLRMMSEVRGGLYSDCQMIVASHNEISVIRAMEAMQEMGIKPEDDTVVFGQIYGMADHISNTLSRSGYVVYKSVPFGQLEQVLPYLSRRAIENKAVLQGSRRDLILLRQAIKNRLLGRV